MTYRAWVFTLTLLALPCTLYADEALEKRYLARLLQEIGTLKQLSHAAEHYQSKNTRNNERFRYDWLREDLNKIEHGLREKLHLPQVQPRTVAPLKGEYLSEHSSS